MRAIHSPLLPTPRSLWAVVPVKPFHESKSRLAHILTPEQRAELCHALLRQTLSMLNELPSIERILVVSRDPAALAAARHLGALALAETTHDLNEAAVFAVSVAATHQANAALLLPIDLPFARAQDIERLLQSSWTGRPSGDSSAAVAICPDQKRCGTNALLLSLPTPFAFHYGPESFQMHVSEAVHLGLTPEVLDIPSLAFDLDSEEDWQRYQQTIGHRSGALYTLRSPVEFEW